jgi:ubiquinone/menaquinone biosynthesis C-methylase UbiE
MSDPNSYSIYPEYPLTGRIGLAYNWIPAGARSLLDAGCAWGYATRFFAGKCPDTSGIEISDHVEIARQRYPHIAFYQGSLESTPFADASFDVVVMSDVLEHVDNEIAALDEIARVLRPGGTFIVSTPRKGLFSWLDPYNYGYALRKTAPALYRLAYRLSTALLPL